MWRFCTIVFIFFCNLLAVSQEEYVDATITRNNSYSFKYFSFFNQTNENLVLCPFGAASTMAMAYIGSEGNTQQQIARSLNFITPYGVLYGFKQLIKRYQTYKSPDLDILIGNAFWSNSQIEVQKKYKNLLKVNFGSHVEDLPFQLNNDDNSKTINRWVKKSSNYKILNIIKPDEISEDDQIIFTNYVYLDGNWENSFNEQFTSKDDFFRIDSTKVKVDFMNQTSYLRYNENDIFQILEMPYSGRNVSMIVLIPKRNTDLDSIYKAFNSVNFDFWTSELYYKLVDVSIPKFRIENTQDISTVLSLNGCESIFTAKADFSRMSDKPVHISKIIQTAVITFEENNNNNFTEQVISPEQSRKTKDDAVIKFKADKPFLFVVKDNVINSILMIGQIIYPSFSNLSAEYYKNN